MSEKSKQNIYVLLHAPSVIPDSQTTPTQCPVVPSFSQIMAPRSGEPCADNHHLEDHSLSSMSGQTYYLLVNIASVAAI